MYVSVKEINVIQECTIILVAQYSDLKTDRQFQY